MLNGKDNAMLVKGTHIAEIIQKQEKWHGKANLHRLIAHQTTKINEIDATEEIEWTQLTPN
jgi:hypothetical protein